MKYVEEYRDPEAARQYVAGIHRIVTKSWTIMEICGGQTHSIVKYGIDELLPREVTLVHGPGCPVCVTPVELIDKALQVAARSDTIFCSFGDMLRVPGSTNSSDKSFDLLSAKAAGGDVRIVYSPMDAVRIAQANPEKQVVFFAVGFETTAPANAMSVYYAKQNENHELLGTGLACAGAAGDGSDPRVCRKSRAGVSSRRSRLRGDGIYRVLPDRR